jgi:hypothetical protein
MSSFPAETRCDVAPPTVSRTAWAEARAALLEEVSGAFSTSLLTVDRRTGRTPPPAPRRESPIGGGGFMTNTVNGRGDAVVPEAPAALRPRLPEDLFPAGAMAGRWLDAMQFDLEVTAVIARALVTAVHIHLIAPPVPEDPCAM